MYCNDCGKQISNYATTCPNCGYTYKKIVNIPSRSSLVLMAGLFGGIGGQYLISRRWVPFILSLMFCWTYIPFIIGILDVFLLLLIKRYYEDYCVGHLLHHNNNRER